MSKRKQDSSKRAQDAKEYREGLGRHETARYCEKLLFYWQLAPSSWTQDNPAILPAITSPGIVNYLVLYV